MSNPESAERTEQARRAFEASGNPLYVFEALSYCREEPLPPWVRRYLYEATRAVFRLESMVLNHRMTPSDATKTLSQAFKFTRQGWNAFSDSLRTRDRSVRATIFNAMIQQDVPVKKAADGLGTVRSVRRDVKKMQQRLGD